MSRANRISARAWCRADLAGGTLDIWPLGLLHEDACTINVALGLAVEVVLTGRASGFRVVQDESVNEAATVEALGRDPETALLGLIARHFGLPPVEILVRSSSPRGGGLGASSALTVAMIAAAEQQMGLAEGSTEARAALARDLEAQLMSLPTGRQDHFPALLGGALKIEHRPGGERVSRVVADLEPLARSLVVVYSGQSHFSAGKNWQVVRRRLDGDPQTIESLEGIAEALARRRLLRRLGLDLRRGLAPGVSTPEIERLLSAALEAGAWGGKVCGAGGGGCLAILAPPGRRPEIAGTLVERGADVLAAAPVTSPLEVTVS